MIPCVCQYAGQQLVTGQQAEAYADGFIAVHIANITAGKTYSQLSAKSMAQPKNIQLQAQVATVFKGETLRGMLLNAYGWWKVSQITFGLLAPSASVRSPSSPGSSASTGSAARGRALRVGPRHRADQRAGVTRRPRTS